MGGSEEDGWQSSLATEFALDQCKRIQKPITEQTRQTNNTPVFCLEFSLGSLASKISPGILIGFYRYALTCSFLKELSCMLTFKWILNFFCLNFMYIL